MTVSQLYAVLVLLAASDNSREPQHLNQDLRADCELRHVCRASQVNVEFAGVAAKDDQVCVVNPKRATGTIVELVPVASYSRGDHCGFHQEITLEERERPRGYNRLPWVPGTNPVLEADRADACQE
jgi:hypothetical protein